MKGASIMSMYLFDEYPIIANKTLAKEIGLNEALVLQQINYWIEINKKTGKNFYDGKYWVYNSMKNWQENDFDYMSFSTIKRTFSNLEKEGYILSSNYNSDPRDQTKWYSINEKRLEELYDEIEKRKRENEEKVLENKHFEVVDNALAQNEPMEQLKMNQCSDSNWTNALAQNAPMQWGKMNQPLPKNTTKTTTNNNIYNNTSLPSNVYDGNQEKYSSKFVVGGMDDYVNALDSLRKQTDYFDVNEWKQKDYDEILKILADIMILNDDEKISINQRKIPTILFKERIRGLNSNHIEYISNLITNSQNKIHNIRSYILTAAYNAISTMDAYYTEKVNYELKT